MHRILTSIVAAALVLGTYHTGLFDEGAAEIVAHDPRTQRLFVVNAAAAEVTAEPGTEAAGDLGPEGLHFIAAKDSPAGRPLLAVANEVSGTTTLVQINRG